MTDVRLQLREALRTRGFPCGVGNVESLLNQQRSAAELGSRAQEIQGEARKFLRGSPLLHLPDSVVQCVEVGSMLFAEYRIEVFETQIPEGFFYDPGIADGIKRVVLNPDISDVAKAGHLATVLGHLWLGHDALPLTTFQHVVEDEIFRYALTNVPSETYFSAVFSESPHHV